MRQADMEQRTCKEDGCERPVKGRGMCSRHYLIWWRAAGHQPPPFLGATCATDGCDRRAGKFTGVCRPCYERAYESRNSARRRELRDARRDQIRERSRIRAREYRAAHPEKVRLAQEKYRKRNPERVREAQKRYWTSDRGVLVRRQKVSRRKAAPGSPRVDYAAILEQHGMFCHICSMVIVDKSDLHFDHVIPLALGGPHSADNIRPSHAICNLRKGARVA